MAQLPGPSPGPTVLVVWNSVWTGPQWPKWGTGAGPGRGRATLLPGDSCAILGSRAWVPACLGHAQFPNLGFRNQCLSKAQALGTCISLDSVQFKEMAWGEKGTPRPPSHIGSQGNIRVCSESLFPWASVSPLGVTHKMQTGSLWIEFDQPMFLSLPVKEIPYKNPGFGLSWQGGPTFCLAAGAGRQLPPLHGAVLSGSPQLPPRAPHTEWGLLCRVLGCGLPASDPLLRQRDSGLGAVSGVGGSRKAYFSAHPACQHSCHRAAGGLGGSPPACAPPPAVGHHHPGHRALLPRVPEEGLPLWRDGDCGQELGRHPRPQVVLQVRLRTGRTGRDPPARWGLLRLPSVAASRATGHSGPDRSSALLAEAGRLVHFSALVSSSVKWGQR